LLIARTCASGAAAECAPGAFGGGGGEKAASRREEWRALDPTTPEKESIDLVVRLVKRRVFHRPCRSIVKKATNDFFFGRFFTLSPPRREPRCAQLPAQRTTCEHERRSW
jgi:hypothetical protein